MTDFDFNFNNNTYIEHYTKRKDEIGIVSTALIDMHGNYSELMTQIKSIEDESKNIDFEKNKQFKLKLTNSNPFSSVINSMNVLLDKLYLNFEKLIITNNEIVEKNELLTASEEELKAQFDEINQQKEHINYLAFHDSLTGLPNRRKFVEYFTNEISTNKTGAVILLDIDDFKKINDTMGHVFGDRVLEAIAKRLLGMVNNQIFISRFGGDEFLILIEYDNLIELNSYVKDICNIFNDKFQIDHMDMEIRFSMGIALFPEDNTDVDQLVISADLAMYAVKNSGKNSYKYFDHSMMVNQIRSSNIEIILKEAIKNDGFIIVYQPEVDLKTGKIFSYEALLRLKECNLPPTAFIEVAEKNGSIINIGRIVTEKVIKQLFQWKKAGLEIKPVSVNYSAIQLHDDEYLSFM
jgi:diguanylate cyclase (GGDEF)-like protein